MTARYSVMVVNKGAWEVEAFVAEGERRDCSVEGVRGFTNNVRRHQADIVVQNLARKMGGRPPRPPRLTKRFAVPACVADSDRSSCSMAESFIASAHDPCRTLGGTTGKEARLRSGKSRKCVTDNDPLRTISDPLFDCGRKKKAILCENTSLDGNAELDVS